MITIQDFIEKYNLDPEPYKENFINGHYIGIYETEHDYWVFCTEHTGATLSDKFRLDVLDFEWKHPVKAFKHCADYAEVKSFIEQCVSSCLMN